MNRRISLLVFIFFLTCFIARSQETVLKKGMVIKKSIKIKKSNYRLANYDSLKETAVIVIEGNNIVVDFSNSLLQGNLVMNEPDRFNGIAILIKKGRNITLKNLAAKGYKIALLARDVEGLTLENCDFSYNYRQHLNSTQQKEADTDWMSYHHNEADEWLRYGAAMYLKNCNGAVVKNCKVTGGQNALMMMGCNNALIYNNDFSFNSGIGLGMYWCSNNQVLYNRINFNVRGYSHGAYSRGQDSAGILVYEQSNDNIFYKNSVTHGGDGFFLWAGQTTMDSGSGGCNGNRIWNNDFSYAPANGVEVTFSSNDISGNRIFGCDHGIWGGYSYNTTISGNQFRNNKIAIAIEHGQHNQLLNNLFLGNKEAIRLWSKEKQPSDWGYAKYHDTRSADYLIAINSFNKDSLVFNLTRTDSLKVFGNTFSDYEVLYKADSSVTNIDTIEADLLDTTAVYPVVKNPIDPFKGNGKLAGRKNIMITEWGPYDFRYPIIWNTNPMDTSENMEFEVHGPKGRWKFISVKGLEIDKMTVDTLPTRFSGRRAGSAMGVEIIAEYGGPAFTDPFGNLIPAGKPFLFTFRKPVVLNNPIR
jgi:parallel beta-helix repeat protein